MLKKNVTRLCLAQLRNSVVATKSGPNTFTNFDTKEDNIQILNVSFDIKGFLSNDI